MAEGFTSREKRFIAGVVRGAAGGIRTRRAILVFVIILLVPVVTVLYGTRRTAPTKTRPKYQDRGSMSTKEAERNTSEIWRFVRLVKANAREGVVVLVVIGFLLVERAQLVRVIVKYHAEVGCLEQVGTGGSHTPDSPS